jgi:putative flippase GtrA
LLFFFHNLFQIKIAVATTASFLIAFSISFLLQKFWTFRNKQKRYMKQLGYYLVINLLNLFVNVSLMVFLVDHLKIHYMISQVIVLGGLGITSYLLYKYLVFKK